MEKITISESLRNYIQRLNHTYYSNVNLIVNILNLNIDLDSELYQTYEKELKESYCAYRSVLALIDKEVNEKSQKASYWNLDFINTEIEIKEI